MTAFLPENDPNPIRRRLALNHSQQLYRYNHNYVSPLAIADRVPIQDEFSFRWIETVAKRVSVAFLNRVEVEEDPDHREFHLSCHSHLLQMMERGLTGAGDLQAVVERALTFSTRLGAQPTRPQSLDDYIHLFHTIGLPPVSSCTRNDLQFAWTRLAGPNPVMIENVTSLDDRFPVTDEQFKVSCPNDSLDQALADGRIFLADYRLLDGAEMGDYPHGQKYIYAPLALFVVDAATREFRPVAIQCEQSPAMDNPIFTPNDGWNWLIAKTVVEVADGNMHEAFTHLGRTHFLMEPFVLATFRQLAPNHPLAKLLGPHFQGTLPINEAAWRHLIANKGAVDKLFGCSISASRNTAVKAVQSANVMELLLPETFSSRRVGNDSTLENYPFRDDSLLYWDAIRDWVNQYVGLYYSSHHEVIADYELQNWGTELVSNEGGRLSGLPNNGRLTSVNDIVDVATFVIYTSSVQHAAVNFPQYDIMSYVPNMPLATYSPRPTSKSGGTEADYLNTLPPLDMAELQLELGYLLGTVHYTQLGNYEEHHFRDERVKSPLADFQRTVTEIGGRIRSRNESRLSPYETLMPAGVPQSINI